VVEADTSPVDGWAGALVARDRALEGKVKREREEPAVICAWYCRFCRDRASQWWMVRSCWALSRAISSCRAWSRSAPIPSYCVCGVCAVCARCV
jgi:hypothetical protein